MSVKKCAREECGKTVYPIEELKCLDKVWHKQCFKCTVCGMTLNMKNYKGYEKKPYCEPHYPKTVASVVTDTPEMRRLAENTRNQSQVKYHEEYEKMRGTKIEIADDPEMARHLANTRVQSQAQYHGELGKKVQQDAHRPREELLVGGGTAAASGGAGDASAMGATTVTSHSQISSNNSSMTHSRYGSNDYGGVGAGNVYANSRYGSGDQQQQQLSYPSRQKHDVETAMNRMTVGDYDMTRSYSQTTTSTVKNGNGVGDRFAMSQSTYSSIVPESANGRDRNGVGHLLGNYSPAAAIATSATPDGLSPYSQRLLNQAGSVVFSTEVNGRVPAQEQRKIGSIADYDPMNGNWGSSNAAGNAGAGKVNKSSQSAQKSPNSNPPASNIKMASAAPKNKGITVKALYDYTAADTDEVSFLENDIIVNCEKVDDGWMTGTVQRTHQYGMLPANYVERVNAPTGLHRLH